jgi:hypothetical protein
MTKVKLLSNVHSFSQGSNVYHPGDVFELEGRVRHDFMQVVSQVPVKAVVKPISETNPVEPEPKSILESESVVVQKQVAPEVAEAPMEILPVATVKKTRKKNLESSPEV